MERWAVDINLRHNFVLHKQSLSDKMFTTFKEPVEVYLNILHSLQSGIRTSEEDWLSILYFM